ncbi:collagenase [Pseudoalteromonas fenneropenaei]|uniref:Collagenase n=1 Tax=Pseudoalteromonas fenneropenaei TaxID=1737459 RepID=A0ABV7CM30_9GAMM
MYGFTSVMEFLRAAPYVAHVYGVDYGWVNESESYLDADVKAKAAELVKAYAGNQYFTDMTRVANISAQNATATFVNNLTIFHETLDVQEKFFSGYPYAGTAPANLRPTVESTAGMYLKSATYAATRYAKDDFDTRLGANADKWGAILAKVYFAEVTDPDGYFNPKTQALVGMQDFFRFESLYASGVKMFDGVLAKDSYMSDAWLVAIGWANFREICDQFTAKVCRADVTADMKTAMFPNTYTFDDGKFVVKTSLPIEDIQPLYHGAKIVEAQYKRVAQNMDALADDKNDVLTAYIYGTPTQYAHAQPFLFGLSADNGGMYMEQDGVFYSYQRTEQQSVFTLEELFRHEYVHYLQGRYTVPGIFGDNGALFTNEQLTWWIEGVAEALAGSTQKDGVKVRRAMVEELGAYGEQSIDKFTSAKYQDGFAFYYSSALFINYLLDNDRETLNKMFAAIQANDNDAYMAVIEDIRTDGALQANFSEYVATQQGSTDSLSDQKHTNWIADGALSTDNAQDVEATLVALTGLSDAKCDVVFNTLNKRVGCVGVIPATDATELSVKLDDAIVAANTDSMNVWKGMVATHGKLVDGEAAYYVEVPVATEIVQAPNNAPTVSAGSDVQADEGTSVTLQASGNDVDGDTITYQWTQTGGTAVNFGAGNTAQISFTAPSVDADTTLTFQVTVSDGDLTATDTVVVTVKNQVTNGGNNGGSSSADGGSSGGSFGFISSFLLMCAALIRRKRV